MGIMDRLFGEESEREPRQEGAARNPAGNQPAGRLSDDQAVARYRYLLQTAPPEAIEQAHEEAFAQLTPQQRQMVLEQLRGTVPEYERTPGAPPRDDPRSLARMATRAELREPGTMERIFGGRGGIGVGGGVGLGGMMAGSFLGSLAGMVVGSMIVQPFLGDAFGARDSLAASESLQGADAAPGGDTTADADGDYVGDDVDATGYADAGDMGSEFDADFGGDFGDLGEI